MSEIFFTNPHEIRTPSKRKSSSHYWEHREKTIKILIEMGVPFRAAELSAIDNRHWYSICLMNHLTPNQTALMLFDVVKQSYQKEDGMWYHQ